MKYFLSFLITMIFALSANAATTTTIRFGDNYSYTMPTVEALKFQSQIENRMAELNAELAAKQEKLPKNKEADKFGTFIGETLKSASVETGIPIDVLASSPSISNMITYKYVAKNFMGYIIGSFWFLALIPTWCYFFYRMAIIKTIVNSDGNTRNINYNSSDVIAIRWSMFAALIILIFIGLLITF